ncbi:Sua5 YciO YrdC YwlC family protein [Helicobacter fennelliae]|uniref:Sua5 YciO YrdC YwlC family protein n=1 Tax=Helicobacter fennelliae TaxID=215 RepID=UPI001B343ACC|nr:Sua5 YciO YrdC YwlC family protein [Helicobacter fennelliae]
MRREVLYMDSKAFYNTQTDIVFLAQTDTTAGLLSSDPTLLNRIKNRPLHQSVILTMSDFATLKSTYRTPRIHRHFIRHAKRTSFILPNRHSFRVVQDEEHLKFLRVFKKLYSTSANISKKSFDLAWAVEQCDIVVLDSRGFCECRSSAIFKLNKTKYIRIRK